MAFEKQSIQEQQKKSSPVNMSNLAEAYKKKNQERATSNTEEKYIEELSKPRSRNYIHNIGKLMMLSAKQDEIRLELEKLEAEEAADNQSDNVVEEYYNPMPTNGVREYYNPEPVSGVREYYNPEPVSGVREYYNPEPVGGVKEYYSPNQQPVKVVEEQYISSKAEEVKKIVSPLPHIEVQKEEIEEKKDEPDLSTLSPKGRRRRERAARKVDLESSLQRIDQEVQECIQKLKEEAQSKIKEPVEMIYPSNLASLLLEKGIIKHEGKPITDVNQSAKEIESQYQREIGEKMAQSFRVANDYYWKEMEIEDNDVTAKQMWFIEYRPDSICLVFADGSVQTYIRGNDWR